jgi:hypothetical protein
MFAVAHAATSARGNLTCMAHAATSARGNLYGARGHKCTGQFVWRDPCCNQYANMYPLSHQQVQQLFALVSPSPRVKKVHDDIYF